MDWANIGIAVAGSIGGSVLTLAVQWRLKRVDHRNAFYLQLINKRLDAYNAINQALRPFWLTTEFHEQNVFSFVFFGEHDLKALLNGLTQAVDQNRIWIDAKTTQAMHDFHHVASYQLELDFVLESDPETVLKYAGDLKSEILKAQLALERGFLGVQDIKGFLSDRKSFLELVEPSV